MYEKALKRSKDGTITRYIGANAKGVPEKFRLGYDLQAAEQRVKLIAAIWQEIELKFRKTGPGLRPVWDEKHLRAAKAIARGEAPTLPKRDFEDTTKYVERVAEISRLTGQQFEPSDTFEYGLGLLELQDDVENGRHRLSTAIGVPNATGKILSKAIDAYSAYVRKEFTLPNGRLKPWGKTQLDELDAIRQYLQNEKIVARNFTSLDLAELNLATCDEIYAVFRKRPLTIRSKFRKRMTPASAKNLIKMLGNFFDWLDGSDDFDWTPPRRFHSIKKTPDELTAIEKYERRLAKERSVIPDEYLKKLNEYAIPSERILILLGLNCAFGAGEIGQLRQSFVKLDAAVIDGIRFKSGNVTKQRLWKPTIEGLVWAFRRRQELQPADSEWDGILFLTDRGRPLWRYTDEGNVSDGISNAWNRLIKRIRADDSTFPPYSFNKLRKTAATRILRIASAEVASMLLAHKTISEDELLHHYALLPWEKLFEAQLQLERELGAVFAAAGPDPWDEQPKTYIGLAKAKQIIQLHEEGKAAETIADELGINIATVYRHLRQKYGHRKRGRKPKASSSVPMTESNEASA